MEVHILARCDVYEARRRRLRAPTAYTAPDVTSKAVVQGSTTGLAATPTHRQPQPSDLRGHPRPREDRLDLRRSVVCVLSDEGTDVAFVATSATTAATPAGLLNPRHVVGAAFIHLIGDDDGDIDDE